MVKMKTLIKKLKLGVLLIALAVLTSCGSEVTITSVTSVNAIYRSIPTLALTATKYTGIKISKYFMHSSAAKVKTESSGKKMQSSGRSSKVMPISIGIVGETQLDWSKPLNK
jgi:hypothetical protein